MIFVLQYKLAHEKDNVYDYKFQITPGSLSETHTIPLKYIDSCWGYDEARQTSFDMKFNLNLAKSHTDNPTMDDIESITISKTYHTTGSDSGWLIQYQWKEKLDQLVKKLNDLEIVLKYEQENMDSLSEQKIEKINEKILQHQTDIEKIKNESCSFKYEDQVEIKYIILPKSKLGRMDFYTSSGRGYYSRQIDFYWNIDELINLNIFNVQDVENITMMNKQITTHEKMIPKLSVEQKIKHRKLNQ